MNSDERQVNAEILVELQNAVMHRFVNAAKSLFSQGNAKLAKVDNQDARTVYFINLNSFYFTLTPEVVFLKLEYDQTVSYLFPYFDNGFTSISLMKNAPLIHNFEEIIRNVATLMNFDELTHNPEIKEKLQQHCPGVEKEPIFVTDKIKIAIKGAGKIIGEAFRTMGTLANKGVEVTGEFIEKKIEEPAEKKEVTAQTKQKWAKLKNGTGAVIQFSISIYNSIISPLIEKGKNYGKGIVEKIDNSSNEKLKYAKGIAETSGEALIDVFTGMADGAKSVGNQLGNQSRKIVHKKLGEDYVNTFIPNEEKGEERKEKTEMRKEEETEQEAEVRQGEGEPLYPYLKKND